MPQEDADLSSSQILDESLDNTALDNTVLDTTTNADNTIVEEQNDDLPTLDALVYEYERTQRPGVPYDPDECITLLEKFVLFAEAHTTNETVFDIAFRLSTFITSRGFRSAEAFLANAKLNYMQGDFIEARKNLALAKSQVVAESREEEFGNQVMLFEEKLGNTIVQEGQKMFVIFSAVVAVGVLWFLSSRKKN